MSTLTTTLALPEPLASADNVSAHTQYGCRSITWTCHTPGSWHRCGYSVAWFEVSERTPWAGEPLHLSATRRFPGHSTARSTFTLKALQEIHAEVIPVIAAYGFGRLWEGLHRGSAAGDWERVDEAREALGWWQACAELRDWYRDDQVGVQLFPVAYLEEKRLVRVIPRYHGQGHTEQVVGTVFSLVDGEQVGWLTRDGQLVPKVNPSCQLI